MADLSIDDVDTQIRMAAFDWLSSRLTEYEEVLPRQILAEGFEFRGQRVPLLGPQGIFKPRIVPEIPVAFETKGLNILYEALDRL